jgi:transposase-like protein
MDERVRQFRGARRAEGGQRGYPVEARSVAVAYARARQREGATVHRVARELGIPMTTLQSWMRRSTSTFQRVTVETAPASAARLVVRTPSGLIVEGLDVTGVAELSRALSSR